LVDLFEKILELVAVEIRILIALFAFYLLAVKWDRCRHLRSIWEASMQLRRLHKIKHPAEKMLKLRTIDPFVFEEMLLTAFKKRGYKIKRNKRYTGDGGIDGMVFIKGHWHAIQAKRYTNHINLKDVKKLSQICRRDQLKGLFIHTGKTGAKSREAAQQCPLIQIISGDKVLKLLSWPRKKK
jgi:restriction system protein